MIHDLSDSPLNMPHILLTFDLNKAIMHPLRFTFLLLCLATFSHAQDTFSIVAADSTTREVGSAAASCVDLFQAGIADATFLGDLLPDTGAINTQSFYLAANQNIARARMRAGDSPAAIINWLVKFDVEGNPLVRQYGIVGFTGTQPGAAGYTGTNCFDYKNHITGSIDGIHYAIQGNILLGQQILDSMESRFRNAEGDLACRLMAALQGAKVVGADTRCASNGSSSLFAFVKVAQQSDTYGNPSLILSVRTRNSAGIEPIDSLQTIFNAAHSCQISGTDHFKPKRTWNLQPNPARNELLVRLDPFLTELSYRIVDIRGRNMSHGKITEGNTTIDISPLNIGWYILKMEGHGQQAFIKIE